MYSVFAYILANVSMPVNPVLYFLPTTVELFCDKHIVLRSITCLCLGAVPMVYFSFNRLTLRPGFSRHAVIAPWLPFSSHLHDTMTERGR